jgi:uncharacterized RDD family membrane protein YckC
VKIVNHYRVAGFWSRFWAYVLDLFCVFALSSVIVSVIVAVFKIPQNYLSWMKTNTYMLGAVGFAYFAIMTRYWGQTIGKMICGIMVIREDGKEMDWITALVREVAGRTVSQFLGSYIGYLIIPFVKNKRSCHDLLCDTYVVHVDELEEKRWVAINAKPDAETVDEFKIEDKKDIFNGFVKNTEEKYAEKTTDAADGVSKTGDVSLTGDNEEKTGEKEDVEF